MKTVCIMGSNSSLGVQLKKTLSNNFKLITASRKNCDLTQLNEVENFFNTIESFDCYVHCTALRSKYDALQDISNLKNMLDVNVTGAVYCLQNVIKKINPHGKIIVIGSSYAAFGNVQNSMYVTSKAALHAYARCLGAQIKDQFELCCIAPGTIYNNNWSSVTGFINCFFMDQIHGLHGQVVRIDDGHHTFPI